MRLFFLLFLLSLPVWGQIGIGAAGTTGWPGAQASANYDIRFKGGLGYSLFLRHDVGELYGNTLHLKYSAGKSTHRAELPQAGETLYRFSEFGIYLVYENNKILTTRWPVYAGAGLSLLSLVSDNQYREDYNDQSLLPHLLCGVRWLWYDGFDLYTELDFYFGKNGAGPEDIPVSGVTLKIGLTMYITEPGA